MNELEMIVERVPGSGSPGFVSVEFKDHEGRGAGAQLTAEEALDLHEKLELALIDMSVLPLDPTGAERQGRET